MLYEEWDSCVNVGLDLWMWFNDIYTREFKGKVMAFAGLRHLEKMHTEDAISRKLERQSKR